MIPEYDYGRPAMHIELTRDGETKTRAISYMDITTTIGELIADAIREMLEER